MAYPQASFDRVVFAPRSFWAAKRAALSSSALLYQLQVLKDTGRYTAFQLQWHPIYDDPPEIWPIPKHQFWDSDVAKWMEGACYFLQHEDNATVRASVEELVAMIAAAQQPDGYLNIHYTVVEPGKRFTNLRDMHELYNAGHLIEAALAHEQVFQNGQLLGPVQRYADYLADVLGPLEHQKHGYPGHPEIELALLRLSQKTGNARYLQLAKYFVTERGNPHGQDGRHYYDLEAEQRGETRTPDYFPEPRSYWYQQAHLPLLEQQTIEGHSVRATYLLTALSDLIRLDQTLPPGYRQAVERLWNNMVNQKMYLTGGIGVVKQWEGFTYDYFLPQGTDEGGCYAETCASIGVMMLADRMLELDLNGCYGDIMELCLYNAVLTGVSCNGKEWTYVNQLASSDQDLSQRSAWFTVACCPPNVLRLLGSLGGYLYSFKDQTESQPRPSLSIHLFASASINLQINGQPFVVKMETKWPLDGEVRYDLDGPVENTPDLWVRRPQWAQGQWRSSPAWSADPESEVRDGFIRIPHDFLAAHRSFTLTFDMRPRLIRPHPATGQNVVAVARGPIVYCVEDVDNAAATAHFKNTLFDVQSAKFEETSTVDAKSGEEYVRVVAKSAGLNLESSRAPPGPGHDATLDLSERERFDLTFVPYYFRSNRGGKGHMRVGLTRAE